MVFNYTQIPRFFKVIPQNCCSFVSYLYAEYKAKDLRYGYF